MPDNYGMPSNFHVGDMRYRVILGTRQQVAQADETGIDESLQNSMPIWASIQPTSPMTFIGSSQIEMPYTHRIIIRFRDGIDMFDVVLRQLMRDDGTVRFETFRIRRSIEIGGRQRFLALECELETKVG